MSNGMPSLSTIKRGFGILVPEEFSARFIGWIRAGVTLPDKDIVSIDGKTSKGSRFFQRPRVCIGESRA